MDLHSQKHIFREGVHRSMGSSSARFGEMILCIRMPSGNWECVWFLTISMDPDQTFEDSPHAQHAEPKSKAPVLVSKPGLSASKRDKNWEDTPKAQTSNTF